MRTADYIQLALLSVMMGVCKPKDAEVSRTLKMQAVHIVDGDTFDGRDGSTTLRIRLHGIDAPERGQDFSRKSKETLGELCGNGPLSIGLTEKDRYGRWVAVVHDSRGLCVNEEMVARGMAWHFTRYSSDARLERLEAKARRSRIGLWAMDNPTPPWEYRDAKRR